MFSVFSLPSVRCGGTKLSRFYCCSSVENRGHDLLEILSVSISNQQPCQFPITVHELLEHIQILPSAALPPCFFIFFIEMILSTSNNIIVVTGRSLLLILVVHYIISILRIFYSIYYHQHWLSPCPSCSAQNPIGA